LYTFTKTNTTLGHDHASAEKKKEYKSSILNQNIQPAKIMAGLNYLICNNPLYKDIHRNTDSEHEWSQLINQ
jgi:hypothetical protein